MRRCHLSVYLSRLLSCSGIWCSSKGHTPREAKDNLKSTQLLSVIDAISEGPVEGPVDGLKSVLLNSTPVLDSEEK
ncbi:hypothetical protein PUR50_30285 [Enterobacter hormaechei subsp. steigerwaltii]|nr:hypothetical protein [Enterobacter hormaechei subsp. steigerwaltii]